MSREKIITNLQQAVYILNFAAVCLVAGSMSMGIFRIVDAMEAEMFLSLLKVRPWNPRTIIITSIAGYLCLVLLSCAGQLWEHRGRYMRVMITLGEMVLCIWTTVALNMNYNGLVLLVVADMVRGQKGRRQKLILGIAIVGLYTIVNYNLTGACFNMIPWESFLTAYSASTQAFLKGILSVFSSMNLVLFILYMTMLIQGEYRERERIQNLNEQLEEANRKLKEYAAEAERNAETRERNRLAREIHDTLGHALTGIVAGIDASLTMMDISPEATRQQLVKIGEVARQGMTDVRRSVSKLRPDALEKLDLEDALVKMLKDAGAASGADIRFHNQVKPLKFHEDEEEVVYRVVQEAATNAIRHGHADEIAITISKEEGRLTIEVHDNGIGCGQVEEGFGLKHMKERLSLLEGTLEYGGREGFYIIARIPIRWGEEH